MIFEVTADAVIWTFLGAMLVLVGWAVIDEVG